MAYPTTLRLRAMRAFFRCAVRGCSWQAHGGIIVGLSPRLTSLLLPVDRVAVPPDVAVIINPIAGNRSPRTHARSFPATRARELRSIRSRLLRTTSPSRCACGGQRRQWALSTGPVSQNVPSVNFGPRECFL